MKDGRLFQLLYYLVERRSATARELAGRFEVSERTIYRDVDALSAAGIPVYAQRGKGGGVRLMDQFVLDRALLSPEQQDEILFALRAILATRASEEGDTLSRLSALFRRESGDRVEVLSPERWRELLAREGEKILALYKTGHTVSDLECYPDIRRTGDPSGTSKEGISMETREFCQCCGMPLDDPKDRGTEADGSPSRDYCRYCYQGGAFTAPDAAVEDMIAFNLKFNEENGHPFGPQEQAEKMLRAWLPTLKRWRKD